VARLIVYLSNLLEGLGDEKTQYRSDNMSIYLPHGSIRKSLRGMKAANFVMKQGTVCYGGIICMV
jgi:hypothetical protein